MKDRNSTATTFETWIIVIPIILVVGYASYWFGQYVAHDSAYADGFADGLAAAPARVAEQRALQKELRAAEVRALEFQLSQAKARSTH